MKNSIHQLTKISETVNSHQTYYKFNKMDEHLNKKYRKGRVNAKIWLNDIIYYFIQKESCFIIEFIEHLQEQKKSLASLEDGDFKKDFMTN
jgi:predicted transcriptional regulator